jgi:hypothetical protein
MVKTPPSTAAVMTLAKQGLGVASPRPSTPATATRHPGQATQFSFTRARGASSST